MNIGSETQRVAEAHLGECWRVLWAEEGDIEPDEDAGEEGLESPACAPFCGCDTCVVREVLYAAWPVLEHYFEGSRTEIVGLLREAISELGLQHELTPRLAVALTRLQRPPSYEACAELSIMEDDPSGPPREIVDEIAARRPRLQAVPETAEPDGVGGVVLQFRGRRDS